MTTVHVLDRGSRVLIQLLKRDYDEKSPSYNQMIADGDSWCGTVIDFGPSSDGCYAILVQDDAGVLHSVSPSHCRVAHLGI